MRSKTGLMIVATALLSGCKALVPYHSAFMCEKTNDYGKCMDVQHAYDDAVSQESGANDQTKHPHERSWRYRSSASKTPDGKTRRLVPKGQGAFIRTAALAELSGQALYQDQKYRELAGLIDQPATPLVRPPHVLRTLIVTYTAADSLYMPRYVYFFTENAKFVMGEPTQSIGEARTLYPNGMPTAQKR